MSATVDYNQTATVVCPDCLEEHTVHVITEYDTQDGPSTEIIAGQCCPTCGCDFDEITSLDI